MNRTPHIDNVMKNGLGQHPSGQGIDRGACGRRDQHCRENDKHSSQYQASQPGQPATTDLQRPEPPLRQGGDQPKADKPEEEAGDQQDHTCSPNRRLASAIRSIPRTASSMALSSALSE